MIVPATTLKSRRKLRDSAVHNLANGSPIAQVHAEGLYGGRPRHGHFMDTLPSQMPFSPDISVKPAVL